MPIVERTSLPGTRAGRLLYAQVHEDPRLEIEALAPVFGGRIAVVTSGGCTALSLRAAGATDVTGIDNNPSQNHVAELKAVACARMTLSEACAFIDGPHMNRSTRLKHYASVRELLGPEARHYWDAREDAVGRGINGTGVSERFLAGIARVMRLLVHPRSRIEALIACRTLDEQRSFYHREWNTRRWRMLFRALLTRGALERTYDPAMYTSVRPTTLGSLFHAQFERTITELEVTDNYFLHQALLGRYLATTPPGLPPYLERLPTDGRMALVDASLLDYLRLQPPSSISGFAISNVCEWLDAAGIDALFGEIARTARNDAIVCFRNFIGWTEVPDRWRSRIVEDRERGAALFARDRSLVNRRFAVCVVVR